jgi:predicted alpha/beta-hydrolase family hydrolase
MTLILTHGAGGNRNAPLLVAIERALGEHGVTVVRYDLPFRQARAAGPPRPPDAALDRAGLREQVSAAQARGGPVWLGGMSYGGRQASMLVSEHAGENDFAAGLVLLSYPLHPPGKPGKLRTAHLPQIRIPTLIIQGAKDPFGSIAELTEALALIPAPKRLVAIENAGHDLGRDKTASARRIAAEFLGFFAIP